MISKGRAASSGVATGTVKVITRLGELSKLKQGDILVVKQSNPAWTVGMMKAAAMVSETGGIISHVAIVAREMGIPCVVGVENATALLKDGDVIRVDGSKGVIYEHDG